MSGGAQLMLWPDLPVPAAAPTPIRPPLASARALSAAQQLAFAFVLRTLDRDDIDDDDPFYSAPVHRMIRADELPAPEVRGPRSVFDMAAIVADAGRMLSAGLGRFGSAEQFAPPKRLTVQREAGVTRVAGAAYPANRWDDERIEQERQRRARQKPPKPTGKAKTRGKKVRAWDGEGDE